MFSSTDITCEMLFGYSVRELGHKLPWITVLSSAGIYKHINKIKSTTLLWTRQLLNKTLCSYTENIYHTWARLEHTPQKTVDINGRILYAETINSDSHV